VVGGERGRSLFRQVLVDLEDEHVGARGHQVTGDVVAEALSGARDDGRVADQFERSQRALPATWETST
jgi:hypothetical protein